MDSAKTILSTVLLSFELLGAKGARSRRAREQHTNPLLAQKSAGLALVRLLTVTVNFIVERDTLIRGIPPSKQLA
jgi:hypothetical protein